MTPTHQTLIFLFILLCLAIFVVAVAQLKRKNPFGLTPPLFFIGAFVWGDAAIFSLFWILVSVISLWANNWYLFLLFHAVFWVIRGLGETLYWLNQQFSTLERNPPKTLLGFRFFRNDSIWFVYQIFWQCVTVTALIATIYCSWLWLNSLM